MWIKVTLNISGQLDHQTMGERERKEHSSVHVLSSFRPGALTQEEVHVPECHWIGDDPTELSVSHPNTLEGSKSQ